MKYVVLITLFICCSCRSHRSSIDMHLQEQAIETKRETRSEKISANQALLDIHRSVICTDIDEDIITIRFDSAGNLQSIQGKRRTTRQNELANSTRRSSDDTLTSREEIVETHAEANIELEEHQESEGDSRSIQGWKEWGIIAFMGGVVVTIIWLIKRKKDDHYS